MLSVEDALERVLSFFSVLEPESKPIVKSQGQVLSEDIIANMNVPSTDNSAMDGYAVSTDSIRGASKKTPVKLQVIGSIAAGQVPQKSVSQGTAIRIMTGASIPIGADAVIQFEHTDEVERKEAGKTLSEIQIFNDIEKFTNIRPAGQDFKNGDLILNKGTVIRPAAIGLLASTGYSQVNVIRKPKVSILATGNELIEPTSEHSLGKTYDSNSYSLTASVLSSGAIANPLGIATDDMESIGKKLKEGLKSDMIISSAGVSKGDYDMVKDVLMKYGKIDFWSVKMRPAKPIAFGILKNDISKPVPFLGLPGNPVSALVAFEQFGRAAISKMMGKNYFKRPTIKAKIQDRIDNIDGRRVYARVIVTKNDGEYYAHLTGNQSSNLLTSMAHANGLAICPEDMTSKKPGEMVDVLMIDWPEWVF